MWFYLNSDASGIDLLETTLIPTENDHIHLNNALNLGQSLPPSSPLELAECSYSTPSDADAISKRFESLTLLISCATLSTTAPMNSRTDTYQLDAGKKIQEREP